jgi:DNA-binding IclR family transcriptional regulator
MGVMPSDSPPSQTLARGLRILDLLADAGRPMSVAALADCLGVHRSVAYRLVRTLEDSSLVVRDAAGLYAIGPHVATLARSVATDLQSAARPELQRLADELGMTAFLVVLDRSECVTLLTTEPRTPVASIAQRPGSRHSVLVGAPGIAIQTLLSSADRVSHGIDEPEAAEVASAREAGYASSHGEVIPGVTAIAAPVAGAVPAAIAVLFVSGDNDRSIGERVRAAADTIARAVR